MIATPDRTDYLAALPAFLMCALTLIMVLLDAAIPGMYQEQYQDYPALYRMTHGVITAAGILFWILYLRRHRPWTQLGGARLGGARLGAICFAAFSLWMILTTLIAGLDDKAIHGVSFRNLGILHLILLTSVYMFLSAQLQRRSLRQAILIAYAGIADLMALLVLLDRIHPIPAFAAKKEISAIFFNGNHYGYFLTMAILVSAGLCIFSRERGLQLFFGASFLLNLMMLLWNNSFGCILAVFASLLITALLTLIAHRQWAKRLWALLGLLVLLGLTGGLLTGLLSQNLSSLLSDLHAIFSGKGASSAGHNRWLLWTSTCEFICQHPIFGSGCEGITDQLMAETGRGNPHNEVLTYAAWFGIPGAAFYTAGVILSLAGGFQAAGFSLAHPANGRQATGHASGLQAAGHLADSGSAAAHLTGPDPISLAAAMAALGYFLSSFFGVMMFYTTPFFFLFLGLALGGGVHEKRC